MPQAVQSRSIIRAVSPESQFVNLADLVKIQRFQFVR
jgi:hypothetical protein